MATAHGHLSDGDDAPLPFQHAVDALLRAHVRPGVELTPIPAPRRLAPYAYALEAAVTAEPEGEELADGRLVLLHDPDGPEAWRGTFRLVTLVQAELEPEMAADPLLPEVSWSWLMGALEAHGALHLEPSGTVSRASSHYFGALADRADSTQIEIRASWTPREGPGGVPDAAAHLAAWCDLLCTSAGLPPAGAMPTVLPLPNRRGPRG
ncbi:DUF3000 domain-containing protein [Actinacidiphila oryziradicis]|jgi:hypothetical protein|uniref:DUF3000 domain-containing protein n=1 Tax=Actinacidiphila oryziradicis TaxID=2571141 RepID=A0A4U0SAU8_9ACTN|nr:DUF3000 domain-containing protein [Actinacidiphila oryziradicis]MCW2875393.1 hypothetical protein [Actinacidiphila oryziradicis]TKA06454.1 DUF3000 domain-containing protein [Actinacidiphila oryziradicis]